MVEFPHRMIEIRKCIICEFFLDLLVDLHLTSWSLPSPHINVLILCLLFLLQYLTSQVHDDFNSFRVIGMFLHVSAAMKESNFFPCQLRSHSPH